MKKTIAIILTALLITSFTACGNTGSDNGQTSDSSVSSGNIEVSSDESTDSSGNSKSGESSEKSGQTFEDIFGENSSAPKTDSSTAPSEESSAQNSENKQRHQRFDQSGQMPQMPDQSGQQPPEMPDQSGQMPQMPEQSGQMPQMPEQSGNVSESSAPEFDTTDIFSSRDLTQTADTSSAKTIQASNNKTETITEEGVYIITGTATDFTVRVEASKEAKVQLVLDGLNVTNSDFPVIYVVSADKCFVTTAGTENNISVTGTFRSDGDTNTDAVIFSKDDLVLNGTGTIKINSSANGISGKDDVKITGGTYKITTVKDSIEANDSISVYDGSIEISTQKDGFHSENDDDDTKGYIYIRSGSFKITAKSDAVQATTLLRIDGGTFELNSAEGLEATYVQINDGNISINASDDGINASTKSRSYGTPTIEFNGGNTKIVMGQGDTDAVDANGNIIVNGGTIDITATVSSFDYDGTAQYNGGTIIINGTQVDSIPQSMMGGGRMGGMGGRGNMGGFDRGNMMR